MWIKTVTLKNFGCHEYNTFEFKRGLCGIFGPNGSGKSTITDGIYYALTGDLGRFDGVKTDQIRIDAGEKDKAYIEVTAEHNDVEFTIHRSLRPNKQWLEIAGREKRLTKSGDIQDGLQALGVDAKLVGTYVFVSQWSMFDFISQTPGDRAKTYQHLCNTGKAQQVVDAIDKLMEQDDNLSVTLVDNSDEIRGEISTLREDYEKHRADYKAAKLLKLPADIKSQHEETLAKRERRKDAKTKILAAEEKLEQLTSKAEVKYQNLKDELNVRDALIENDKDCKKDRKLALGLIDDLKDYKFFVAKKKRLDQQFLEYSVKVTKPPVTGDPVKRGVKLDGLKLQHRKQVSKYEALEEYFEIFKKTGAGPCETCGTVIPQDELDGKWEEFKTLEAENKARQSEIDKLDAEALEYTSWKSRNEKLTTAIDITSKQIDELEEVEKPKTDASVEELEGRIEAADSIAEQLDAAKDAARDAQIEADKAKTRIEAAQLQLDELQQIVKDNQLKKSEYLAAKDAMSEHIAAELTMKLASAAGKSVRRSLESREASLASLEEKLLKNARARKFADILGSIKKVFHRQMLPRVVAAENLEDMESGINEGLETFGDPFYVEATDDLSFDVYFPGAPALPAGRLSGGQKGVLAVVFRREIARLFANDLGMMCLDEPTAGMDETNVACLEDALTRYAGELRGKSQVIMITHSDQLRPAFDQIVELESDG